MIFHVDSGHGWLEVSRKKLEKLGIEFKISGFSYQKNDKVYLEEDCDAPIYLEATGKTFADLKRKYYKRDAPMRNYEHYQTGI